MQSFALRRNRVLIFQLKDRSAYPRYAGLRIQPKPRCYSEEGSVRILPKWIANGQRAEARTIRCKEYRRLAGLRRELECRLVISEIYCPACNHKSCPIEWIPWNKNKPARRKRKVQYRFLYRWREGKQRTGERKERRQGGTQGETWKAKRKLEEKGKGRERDTNERMHQVWELRER